LQLLPFSVARQVCMSNPSRLAARVADCTRPPFRRREACFANPRLNPPFSKWKSRHASNTPCFRCGASRGGPMNFTSMKLAKARGKSLLASEVRALTHSVVNSGEHVDSSASPFGKGGLRGICSCCHLASPVKCACQIPPGLQPAWSTALGHRFVDAKHASRIPDSTLPFPKGEVATHRPFLVSIAEKGEAAR